MPLQGEYIYKTGQPYSTEVGDYFLLRFGLWARQEAGNLLSGPYKTADGISFSIVDGGGPPPAVTGLQYNDAANSMYQGPATGLGIGVN